MIPNFIKEKQNLQINIVSDRIELYWELVMDGVEKV